MNNYFLKKYLKNLTKNDINTFLKKQKIILNNTELDKIYNYIKNNNYKYFNNTLSKEKIILDAKDILTKDNFNKLYKLYDIYKDKI